MLLYIAVVFVVGLWLSVLASKVQKNRTFVVAPSSIRYPHILKASLVTVGGATKAATLEIRPDVVNIYFRSPESLVGTLRVNEIDNVSFKDMTREGYPQAGLTIDFTRGGQRGQYQFFSDSVLSTRHLSEAAAVLISTVNSRTTKILSTGIDPNCVVHRPKAQ